MPILFSAMALTLIQTYFSNTARTSDGGENEIHASMICVGVFMAVLVSIILMMHECIASKVMGIVLVLCACVVVMGHYSCVGKADCKSVVFLRLSVGIVASASHIVVLCTGRNRLCD